jgi:hypothetical protein
MNAVLSIEFWKILEDCLRASQPLVVILRLIDSDKKLVMGHIAQALLIAKQGVKR